MSGEALLSNIIPFAGSGLLGWHRCCNVIGALKSVARKVTLRIADDGGK